MEPSAEHELNPEWTEAIKEGLAGALENFELFDQLVATSPFLLTEGVDEREFQELSSTEQAFVTKTLFEELGINPKEPIQVATYQTEKPSNMKLDTSTGEAWSGIAEVLVCQTARSEEGMDLHLIKYPGGIVEYFVAPRETRL